MLWKNRRHFFEYPSASIMAMDMIFMDSAWLEYVPKESKGRDAEGLEVKDEVSPAKQTRKEEEKKKIILIRIKSTNHGDVSHVE